ncbi:MAG: hypothetical protein GX868_10010 [Actinobacteria bacterium]|nr:hypothetical protein [Actinomycetota bacterium]
MSDKTKVTELVTALGMLGGDHPLDTLPVCPPELRGVDPTAWADLVESWLDPTVATLVDAAYDNGRFFRRADDALRNRPPRLIEWTGPQRSPGDEVAPVDLRVDHVYLVSCKYLSKITMNASPGHLFERLLTGGHGRRGADWYQDIAPTEWLALWNASRSWLVANDLATSLPDDPSALDRDARKALGRQLKDGAKAWPAELIAPYQSLCEAVAVRSAERWNASLAAATGAAEAMLWRLLRIGSAPYFVLGNDAKTSAAPLRLRVASPWDWRQAFRFRRLYIEPLIGGQPMVSWRASYLRDGHELEVCGHVEIRWSHGRFSGPPEAKVYLDTPFDRVPGYFALG